MKLFGRLPVRSAALHVNVIVDFQRIECFADPLTSRALTGSVTDDLSAAAAAADDDGDGDGDVGGIGGIGGGGGCGGMQCISDRLIEHRAGESTGAYLSS